MFGDLFLDFVWLLRYEYDYVLSFVLFCFFLWSVFVYYGGLNFWLLKFVGFVVTSCSVWYFWLFDFVFAKIVCCGLIWVLNLECFVLNVFLFTLQVWFVLLVFSFKLFRLFGWNAVVCFGCGDLCLVLVDSNCVVKLFYVSFEFRFDVFCACLQILRGIYFGW